VSPTGKLHRPQRALGEAGRANFHEVRKKSGKTVAFSGNWIYNKKNDPNGREKTDHRKQEEMIMQYTYKTKGTCSSQILLDVENGIVNDVKFVGGCNGNTKGISA